MKYANIDPMIRRWVERNGLTLYTQYHEDEVRSVEVVSIRGRRYQIWIDPPDSGSTIGVHVWDMKKRRADLSAEYASLVPVLDEALELAREWANNDGETRMT